MVINFFCSSYPRMVRQRPPPGRSSVEGRALSPQREDLRQDGGSEQTTGEISGAGASLRNSYLLITFVQGFPYSLHFAHPSVNGGRGKIARLAPICLVCCLICLQSFLSIPLECRCAFKFMFCHLQCDSGQDSYVL